MDMINIKLRKLAVDVLEWNHDEARLINGSNYNECNSYIYYEFIVCLDSPWKANYCSLNRTTTTGEKEEPSN